MKVAPLITKKSGTNCFTLYKSYNPTTININNNNNNVLWTFNTCYKKNILSTITSTQMIYCQQQQQYSAALSSVETLFEQITPRRHKPKSRNAKEEEEERGRVVSLFLVVFFLKKC